MWLSFPLTRLSLQQKSNKSNKKVFVWILLVMIILSLTVGEQQESHHDNTNGVGTSSDDSVEADGNGNINHHHDHHETITTETLNSNTEEEQQEPPQVPEPEQQQQQQQQHPEEPEPEQHHEEQQEPEVQQPQQEEHERQEDQEPEQQQEQEQEPEKDEEQEQEQQDQETPEQEVESEQSEQPQQTQERQEPQQEESSSSRTSRKRARESNTGDENNNNKDDALPFDHTSTDWGSYYDPQNIFCGKYDCYKILGFDYESYGNEKPSTKTIVKRYRTLSRYWHPDKSKHKDAKERFVKIARAYEVLTDHQLRAEYDMMRYNQEAYYQKYGASVLWQYAPKSDVTIIIILLTIVINWFSYAAQKQRWKQVATRLIQAAVEDWTPSMGGTEESKHLREEALEILKERESATAASSPDETNPTSPTNSATSPSNNKGSKSNKSAKKGGNAGKLSAKEKKRLEEEKLRPIVTELVDKIHDFGAGFHQPTWRDLFTYKLVAKWPQMIAVGLVWQTKYWIRRWKGMELNDEERFVLTERAVGHVAWELASEEDRAEMVKRELWIMENLVEWKEEQVIKTWSKADQKKYAQWKKKGFKGEGPLKED